MGAGARRGSVRTGGRDAFTLVEVLVALVVLEIGLLGVVGIGVLAAREVGRAAELQRAAGALDVVADSLLGSLEAGAGPVGAGERVVGAHRVSWSGGAAGVEVEVRRPGGGGVVVRVELPVGP